MKTLIAFSVVFSSLSASAAGVCNDLAQCRDLEVKLYNQLNDVQKKIRDLSGIQKPSIKALARDTSGTPFDFDRYEYAQNYCLGQNLRLPTEREVILMAKDWGLKIRETNYPNVDSHNQAVKNEINKMKEQYLYPVKNEDNTIAFYQYEHGESPSYSFPGNRPVTDIWVSGKRQFDLYFGAFSFGRFGADQGSWREVGAICVNP